MEAHTKGPVTAIQNNLSKPAKIFEQQGNECDIINV